MKWTKDLQAEQLMRQLGIPWEVGTINIADIDQELSQYNQARIDKKIHEDWVMQFALGVEQGDAFPMTIQEQLKPKKRYFTWSGIHRTKTAEFVGDTTIDCYLVTVKDQRLKDIFPRVVNIVHGHTESKESVLEHAKYIVLKHGFKTNEVAVMFRIDQKELARSLLAERIVQDLATNGLKCDLPKSTLVRLSPIAENLNVLKSTVGLMQKKSLSGDRGYQLIDEIKSQRTELQQLGVVAKWERQLDQVEQATASRVKVLRSSNKARLLKLLASFDRFLAHIKTVDQLQLDDEAAHLLSEMWPRVSTKMTSYMKGIKS
jgi:hypothetical protein